MEYILTKPFIKNAKALVQAKPNLKLKIEDCIIDFVAHIFASSYYRKKLTGYKNIHELQIGGDVRIFVEVMIEDHIIKFLNIGTHSTLNLTGSGNVRLS